MVSLRIFATSAVARMALGGIRGRREAEALPGIAATDCALPGAPGFRCGSIQATTSPAEDRDCLPCALIGALLAALLVTVLLKLMVFAPLRPLTLPLDETCSLSSAPCSATLPDGGILEFTLGPRPTPLLKPLAVAVRIDGSDARAVEVDFNGVNLAMAFNRADLTQDGDGVFVGQANLPLCSTTRMEWRATVLVESAGRKIYVPFRFETEKPAPTNQIVGWVKRSAPIELRADGCANASPILRICPSHAAYASA